MFFFADDDSETSSSARSCPEERNCSQVGFLISMINWIFPSRAEADAGAGGGHWRGLSVYWGVKIGEKDA